MNSALNTSYDSALHPTVKKQADYALLVVDAQQGVFGRTPPPFDSAAVIERINRLSDCARREHNPVIFIQHEARGVVEHGSDDWQIHPGISHSPDDIYLRKATADAFFYTALADVLMEYGVNRLIVCGYASDVCIDRTCHQAATQGYRVTLIADAHTCQDKAYASGEVIRQHHNFILACHEAITVESCDHWLAQQLQPA